MKRFDPDIARDVWVATMHEAPDGQYVCFDDVAPLIAALRAMVERGEGCISEPDCGSCKWCDAKAALATVDGESQ